MVCGILFFWLQRQGRYERLQDLATEYGGTLCRDTVYLENYLCHLRHNSRDYYVTYRPIPGEGSDGGDQLLFICKIATPFEFIISSDRTSLLHRIGRPAFEEWPRVQIPSAESHLIFRTPAETLLSDWLALHTTLCQAINRLMEEMSQMIASGNELQVARYLDDFGDPDLAMIKSWISQIDLIAKYLAEA